MVYHFLKKLFLVNLNSNDQMINKHNFFPFYSQNIDLFSYLLRKNIELSQLLIIFYAGKQESSMNAQ